MESKQRITLKGMRPKTVDLTAKELKILRQKNLLTHNQIDAFCDHRVPKEDMML